MSSPTARSLKLLRDSAFIACVVEQTVPGTFIKRDAFHFGDILAMRPRLHALTTESAVREWPPLVALIQTTSGSNLASRRTKILALLEAKAWLQAGGKIYLHGWSKKGKAGKRKLWSCREEELTLADFDPVARPVALQACGNLSDDPEHGPAGDRALESENA